MSISLPIDCYADGYDYHLVSCHELPLAAACGYFDHINYFIYCCYSTFYKNWFCIETNQEAEKLILNKLGLKRTKININNADDLLEKMKVELKAGHPVILKPDYKAIFYSIHYKTKLPGSHGILISDINDINDTVIIRDYIHIREMVGNPRLASGDAMYKFQITKNMLIDMWLNSEDKDLTAIVPDNTKTICSYSDMFNDILANIDLDHSALVQLIENYSKYKEDFLNELNNQTLMRDLCNSMKIVFNVLARMNPVDKKYNSFYSRFFDNRHFIITKLIITAQRNTLLTEEEKQGLLRDAHSYDQKLLSMISDQCDIYLKTNDEIDEKNIKNYALEANATASSEHYSELYNTKYAASHAITGKWDNIREDTWISKNETKIHWIKLDFGKPLRVCKFILKHLKDEQTTVDFKIQGKNINGEWKTLVNIKNNSDSVTIHTIKPVEFRFYRLYITKPNRCDFHARINEFEVWGFVDCR